MSAEHTRLGQGKEAPSFPRLRIGSNESPKSSNCRAFLFHYSFVLDFTVTCSSLFLKVDFNSHI